MSKDWTRVRALPWFVLLGSLILWLVMAGPNVSGVLFVVVPGLDARPRHAPGRERLARSACTTGPRPRRRGPVPPTDGPFGGWWMLPAALRPLVEATILAKWISLDAALNGELWLGQSEEHELRLLRQAEAHHGARRTDVTDEQARESLDAKISIRDAAKKRRLEAGRTYGRRVMPDLERTVQETQEPGHKVAVRQAYELAYRGFSPWAHTEASSFKAAVEISGDTFRSRGDRSPFVADNLRIVAGAMFAYVLEVAGVSAKTGSEVRARFIRDYLTIHRQTAGDPERADT